MGEELPPRYTTLDLHMPMLYKLLLKISVPDIPRVVQ